MTTQADTNSQYPLTDIDAPHAHDVLCGRGGGTNNHIGNNHWRMLVAANKRLYISLPKRQKMLLSRSIVNAIRSQSPPGRFLLKDPRTSKWNDVGDQQAQQKTSQALREGAPDIRRKVDEDEETDEVQTHSESPNEETSATPSATPTGDADTGTTTDSATTTTTTATAAASGSRQAKPTEKEDETTEVKKEKPADDESSNANANANNSSTTPVNPSPGPSSQSMPASMPPQGSAQGMPMHGGMQHPYYIPASQQGTPMWGHQMQPHMQMYQTMVMNEHGVMVPGFAVIPTPVNPMMGQMQYPPMNHNNNMHHPHHQQQQHHNVHQNHDPMGGAPHSNNHYPMNNNGHNMDHHHAMHHDNNNNDSGNPNNTPTFDEYVAAPPDALEGGVGMSFGSVTMTDAEMMRLQATGTSFGSVMSYRNSGGDQVPFPNMDAAMMSIGSNRLEQGGTSFGTMMSYNTMPEGNLEAVGTSFGSLSLEPISRDNSFPPPPPPANGPEIHPMFDKATGNLLECSDTESEAEESNHQVTSQKSAELNKMYESVALKQSKSRGTVGSNELMPPPTRGARRSETSESHGEPLDMNGTVLSVPTTGFQRDFSNVSAWGDDDLDHEGSVLPPQLTKQGSDNDEELAGFLSVKQQSSV